MRGCLLRRLGSISVAGTALAPIVLTGVFTITAGMIGAGGLALVQRGQRAHDDKARWDRDRVSAYATFKALAERRLLIAFGEPGIPGLSLEILGWWSRLSLIGGAEVRDTAMGLMLALESDPSPETPEGKDACLTALRAYDEAVRRELGVV